MEKAAQGMREVELQRTRFISLAVTITEVVEPLPPMKSTA